MPRDDVSDGSATDESICEGQPGAGAWLREMSWAGCGTRGAGKVGTSAEGWVAGNCDRESGAAVARTANGFMWAVPCGRRRAAHGFAVVPAGRRAGKVSDGDDAAAGCAGRRARQPGA